MEMNTPLAFIPGMQGQGEIIVIILIVLLLFGSKKLPELARSIGKSLGEFKRGQKEGVKAMEDALKEDESDTGQPKKTLPKDSEPKETESEK
jgi:TatA/E family protein of Tat protein translocase